LRFGGDSVVASVLVAGVVGCSQFLVEFYVVVRTPNLLFSRRFVPSDDAVVILVIEEVV
jgi:hypothetical protein